MSDVILPVIDYKIQATTLPQISSNEKLNLQLNNGLISYSDPFSSIYSHTNPCDIIQRSSKYKLPTDWKFSKTYIDWLLNKDSVKRTEIKAKKGGLDKVVLVEVNVTLPFTFNFINPNYWLTSGPFVIPTYYVSPETEQWMALKFEQLILSNYNLTIDTQSTNNVQLTLYGYKPSIVFVDIPYPPKELFDNWIPTDITINSYPYDINLTNSKDVFSINVGYTSQISMLTYSEELESKDVYYFYIPDGNGGFKQVNGFISVCNHPLPFDTYNWVLIQSQPNFEVSLELYGYLPLQLQYTNIDSLTITFRRDDVTLGVVKIYSTESATAEYFRIVMKGIGYIEV